MPQPSNDNRPAEFDAQLLKHRKGLHAYALRRYGDEAEDLVQDTFINALARWRAFRPAGNMYTWLVHMLRHTKARQGRRATSKGRPPKAVTNDLPILSTPATQEDYVSATLALAGLPSRLAGMLAMHAAEYTLEEIGHLYGVTRERARQLIKKATNDAVAAATRADTRRALAA